MENALIVVLMGSIPDRALGAVDVYEQGDTILMVRSMLTGYEELEARGLTVPGWVDINEIILLESGVLEEDILILPGNAQSTKDEALIITRFLEEITGVDELILVTSKFHSQRSKLIFKKALNHLGIQILSQPTPYDSFQPTGWYRNREDFKRVVTEYLKLIHFFILEQFQIGS